MPQLKVLTVTKATDIVTGATAIQVNFGEMLPADSPMRERFRMAGQQEPVGAEAAHSIVSLLLPPMGVEPYQVGSEWTLERSASGELTLRRSQ
jgi:hypothetical protein